jgi:translation elongation factor EF-Tu-like GTPase
MRRPTSEMSGNLCLVSDSGDARRNGRFRFAIRDCVAIAGRGVVVTGEIEAGEVRVGDVVELVHGGSAVRMRCTAVEMGHGRGADGTSVEFFGLLLPGIRKFDVAPGDYVRTVDDEG